jgi:cytochrome P450
LCQCFFQVFFYFFPYVLLHLIIPTGFETTSHALSWTMAALAAHPEVQQTLAAELAAAGLTPSKQQQQQQQRGLEWGDLALPYLNAVIKESLRLFSPAALGTSRHCHKDIRVLGHTLPKVWLRNSNSDPRCSPFYAAPTQIGSLNHI